MSLSPLHPTVQELTHTIAQRSRATRADYLARLEQAASAPPAARRMGCANLAHAVAGLTPDERFSIVQTKAPHIGIVTAYNDMLSAHVPLARFPALIKEEARRLGATAQVAGGVPAMCDGITQGTSAMELSLWSRDVIAMGTAVALSHGMFDAALMLGVCDKIVPGLLIGALHFGHVPTVFVPAGPMPSGLPNQEKTKIREQAAQGLVGREGLLQAELQSYHSPGTCTFYGTANSNQMLLEAMGLHVPGTAFVHPGTALRDELTREAVRTVLAITKHQRFTPIGKVVDEKAIVNAMVVLLATGGSTNHLIHWVAVARSAGIVINWNDFSELSAITPLLSHIYPNGSADVNQFQAAGGTGFVLAQLLQAGLLHADVCTVRPGGLAEYTQEPSLEPTTGALVWRATMASKDTSILRPVAAPFSPTGGLQLLQGNLGRGVIKVSALLDDRHVIEAPARVFDSQEDFQRAFQAGELEQDVVCVVRWQGPQANGMPELHQLTPPLGVLQNKGWRVALVTDGRMSGASGKVPAAIHVYPEAAVGGPLAKVRDGDMILLNATTGQLQVQVDASVWQAREAASMPVHLRNSNALGTGRELFTAMRRNVLSPEEGAVSWL